MPQALPLLAVAATVGGTVMQMSGARDQSNYQQQALAGQQQAEAARQQAMELDSKRRQLEQLRTSQRARSLALSNSTASGSQFGSGLQGGYGQISGQVGTNMLGTSQNLELGRNIFADNQQTTNARIGMSQAESNMYMGQGISHIGTSILGNMQNIRNIGRDWNMV